MAPSATDPPSSTATAMTRTETERPMKLSLCMLTLTDGRTVHGPGNESLIAGELAAQQGRRQAGRAAVALERQLRAVVDVHLDALALERAAHRGDAVDHQHDAGADGEDVAAHRVVRLAVDRDPASPALAQVLEQPHRRERLVDHAQLVGDRRDQ